MDEGESSLYLELAQHLADVKREHGGERRQRRWRHWGELSRPPLAFGHASRRTGSSPRYRDPLAAALRTPVPAHPRRAALQQGGRLRGRRLRQQELARGARIWTHGPARAARCTPQPQTGQAAWASLQQRAWVGCV